MVRIRRGWPPLQHGPAWSPWRQYQALYHDIRATYKLSDQHIVRTFRPLGSIAYDSRILAYNLTANTVSIWTVDGRCTIPFVAGDRQRRLLVHQHGESDLVFRNGTIYLLATCEVADPDPIDVDGALGIDLGVTNIAVDSDGTTYSGSPIKNVRYRHRRLRRKLARKGTHGSRRRLRVLAGQEQRFARHTNHVISKHIVATAECTKRAIAVEDLTHIRTRVRARTAAARYVA